MTTYIVGQCYYNACKNKNYYEKMTGKKLKVVIGSLGLNGHFEFGGLKHTTEEFYKNPFDSHAWLEDDEGNIYDYIFEKYGYYCTVWFKRITFPLNYEIVGISKQDLKDKYNLDYIKAPRSAQKDITKNVLVAYRTRDPERYKIIKMVL